jgi:DNA-binding HxlR family transcriptional regulator
MRSRVLSRHVRPVETVLKAVAYRRRLLLLAALARQQPQELRVLAAELRLPLKTVSRNLRVLERAGLVEGTVVRGRAHYQLCRQASRVGQAVTSVVVDAVLDGRMASALSGDGDASSRTAGRRGWLMRSWSRIRSWLARWTSSW